MQISHVKINNFRSIKEISIDLKSTNVLIGSNNAGKSAIVDAILIALSQSTSSINKRFRESDIHLPTPNSDPKTLPPTTITIKITEASPKQWSNELEAALSDIISINPLLMLKEITLKATYQWDHDTETFSSFRQFLNSSNEVIAHGQKSSNFTRLFNYLPIFYVEPLRNAKTEFRSYNSRWVNLLKSIQIPIEVEKIVLDTMSTLDEHIISSDSRFTKIIGTIGEATSVAIGAKTNSSKLNAMPLSIQEVIDRIGILMRNENSLPWLPLLNHGQGLQSLATFFLMKATAEQQLENNELFEMNPLFAIEEPEAHLHPHANKALWSKICLLPGQKILTTHSPYFIHNIPLNNLNLVKLDGNETHIYTVPTFITSNLPWQDDVKNIKQSKDSNLFSMSEDKTKIKSNCYFSDKIREKLTQSFSKNSNNLSNLASVRNLQIQCRSIVTENELKKLLSKSQRKFGEIFFARQWVLLEGETDYLLFHEIASKLNYPLDANGVSVIDFKSSIGIGVFMSIATSLNIPYYIIMDHNGEWKKTQNLITKRGFNLEELSKKIFLMDPENDLEMQLIADGNIDIMREILVTIGCKESNLSSDTSVLKALRNRKIEYSLELCNRISVSESLVYSMPAPFRIAINKLRELHD